MTGSSDKGRRSPRVPAGVPLWLRIGQRTALGHTAIISRDGALMLTLDQLEPGTQFHVDNQQTGKVALAEVVWNSPADVFGGRYKVGVHFIEVPDDFWGDAYPSEEELEFLGRAEEYEQIAADCLAFADETTDEKKRKYCTQLAQVYQDLAERERQKVSEKVP